MQEVKIKTHLIITDIHNEFNMNWCGKIINTKPKFENNKPVFVIIGSLGRMEVNTADMKYLEKCAKKLTYPRGRQAVTTDKARIYIVEEDGKETLMGVLTHNNVKQYAPMFDPVGYKN